MEIGNHQRSVTRIKNGLPKCVKGQFAMFLHRMRQQEPCEIHRERCKVLPLGRRTLTDGEQLCCKGSGDPASNTWAVWVGTEIVDWRNISSPSNQPLDLTASSFGTSEQDIHKMQWVQLTTSKMAMGLKLQSYEKRLRDLGLLSSQERLWGPNIILSIPTRKRRQRQVFPSWETMGLR